VLSRNQSCPQLFSHLLMTAQAAFMLGQGSQVQAILERLQSVSPLPSPGDSILVQMDGSAIPLSFQVPLKESAASLDAPLTPLLQRLGPRSYLLLLSALLCERRIIFLAQELSALSLASHAALAALRPLRWQHMLVPVLPPCLLDYAMAPFPFLLGVQSSHRPTLEKLPLENVIFVDLDLGRMEAFGGMENPVPDICDFNPSHLGMKGQAKIAAAKEQLKNLNQAFSSMKMKPRFDDLPSSPTLSPHSESEPVLERTGSGGRGSAMETPADSPTSAAKGLDEGGMKVCLNLLAEVKSIHQRICKTGGTKLQAMRNAFSTQGITRRYTDLFQDDLICTEDLQLSNALTSLYLYVFGNVRDYTVKRLPPDPSQKPALYYDQDFYIASWKQRNKEPPHLLRFVEEISSSQMLQQFGGEQIQLMQASTLENPPSDEDGLFSKCAFHLFSRKLHFTQSNIQQAMRIEVTTTLMDEDKQERSRSQSPPPRNPTGHGGMGRYDAVSPDTSPDNTRSDTSPSRNNRRLPRFPLRRGRAEQPSSSGSAHLHPVALNLTSSNTSLKDAIQICNQLCREAHGTTAFLAVLRVVWARLQDCKGMRWRHAHHGLTLLRHLLLKGPLAIWSDSVDRLSLLKSLMKFRSQVGDAKVVRSLAQEVLALLLDLSLLTTQRARLANLNRTSLQQPDQRLPFKYLRDFPLMVQEVLNHHARIRGSQLRMQASQAAGTSVTPGKGRERKVVSKSETSNRNTQEYLHTHEEETPVDLIGIQSFDENTHAQTAGVDTYPPQVNTGQEELRGQGKPAFTSPKDIKNLSDFYAMNPPPHPQSTPIKQPQMEISECNLQAESPILQNNLVSTPSIMPAMSVKRHLAMETPLPRNKESGVNGDYFCQVYPTPVPLPAPLDSNNPMTLEANGHGGKHQSNTNWPGVFDT